MVVRELVNQISYFLIVSQSRSGTQTPPHTSLQPCSDELYQLIWSDYGLKPDDGDVQKVKGSPKLFHLFCGEHESLYKMS